MAENLPCKKYFTVADWGLWAQSGEWFFKWGWKAKNVLKQIEQPEM